MQIKGHVHYSALLNQFDLTFWVEDSGAIVTTDLGSLNWQLYDKDGIIITDPEATESGVSPLANGIYSATLVSEVGAVPSTYSTFIPFIITNL